MSATPLALVIALAACASTATRAPEGFLPEPKTAGTSTHGAWIELSVASPNGAMQLAGELLAINDDSIWVTTRPDSLRAVNSGYVVSRNAVIEARLAWYRANPAPIAGLSVLGTLSTASNGYFLIYTAPAWIITGLAATSMYAHEPLVSVVPNKGFDPRSFARFPFGIPAGLDASFRRLGDVAGHGLRNSPSP